MYLQTEVCSLKHTLDGNNRNTLAHFQIRKCTEKTPWVMSTSRSARELKHTVIPVRHLLVLSETNATTWIHHKVAVKSFRILSNTIWDVYSSFGFGHILVVRNYHGSWNNTLHWSLLWRSLLWLCFTGSHVLCSCIKKASSLQPLQTCIQVMGN